MSALLWRSPSTAENEPRTTEAALSPLLTVPAFGDTRTAVGSCRSGIPRSTPIVSTDDVSRPLRQRPHAERWRQSAQAGSLVHMRPDDSIAFQDLESGSEAFLLLRMTEAGLALGLFFEAGGDLGLTVSLVDARRIGTAILAASGDER